MPSAVSRSTWPDKWDGCCEQVKIAFCCGYRTDEKQCVPPDEASWRLVSTLARSHIRPDHLQRLVLVLRPGDFHESLTLFWLSATGTGVSPITFFRRRLSCSELLPPRIWVTSRPAPCLRAPSRFSLSSSWCCQAWSPEYLTQVHLIQEITSLTVKNRTSVLLLYVQMINNAPK